MANQESSTSNDRTHTLNETSERPLITPSQPSSLRAHLAMTEQNIKHVKNDRKTEMEMAAEQKHHESERLPIASAQPSIIRRPSADHPYKRRDTIVKTDTQAVADNTTAIVNQIRAHVTGPDSARNLLERQKTAEMATEQQHPESERPPIASAQPPSASAMKAKSLVRIKRNRSRSRRRKNRESRRRDPDNFVLDDPNFWGGIFSPSDSESGPSDSDSDSKDEPHDIVSDEQRKSLKVGSKVLVFYKYQKEWFKGSIIYTFRDDGGDWLVTKDESGVTQQILRSSKCVRPDPSVQPRKYGEKRRIHHASERSETHSARSSTETEASPETTQSSDEIDAAQPRDDVKHKLERAEQQIEDLKQKLQIATDENNRMKDILYEQMEQMEALLDGRGGFQQQ